MKMPGDDTRPTVRNPTEIAVPIGHRLDRGLRCADAADACDAVSVDRTCPSRVNVATAPTKIDAVANENRATAPSAPLPEIIQSTAPTMARAPSP